MTGIYGVTPFGGGDSNASSAGVSAHCGSSFITYTVATQFAQPYSIHPHGPDDDVHHGAFKISDVSRTVSARISLTSDSQNFYVQPVARFLTWDGSSFTVVSSLRLGAREHLTGDGQWVTITRIADAHPAADYWYFDLEVSADADGLVAPAIGTVLYLDCAFIPESGLSVEFETYLDGSQTGAIWEGAPHNSTSTYEVITAPATVEPPPTGGAVDGGGTSPPEPGTDIPIAPIELLPPPPPPPPTAEESASRLISRVSVGGLCLNADVEIGNIGAGSGVIFNRVDDHGVLWVISDIDGWWTLPEPDIPDFPRGVDDGSYESRGRYLSRVFTLSGSFFPPHSGAVRPARDRLLRAVNLCHYGSWFATHETDATRASKVWLSGRPEISTVKTNGRTDFAIGLRAPDPVKYGLFERKLAGWKEIQISSSSSTTNFGREYNRNYGTDGFGSWKYQDTQIGGGVIGKIATATNDGNVRVSPILTMTGPTEGPVRIVVTHEETGTEQVLRIKERLFEDDVLVIDCQNRTVSLNGIPNKRFYLDTVTDWVYFETGANKIIFLEEVGVSGGQLTIQWRSGWIG